MKAFTLRGTEITICNDGGTYFTPSREGADIMNAPLERGTLVGYIVTCPVQRKRRKKEAAFGRIQKDLTFFLKKESKAKKTSIGSVRGALYWPSRQAELSAAFKAGLINSAISSAHGWAAIFRAQALENVP